MKKITQDICLLNVFYHIKYEYFFFITWFLCLRGYVGYKDKTYEKLLPLYMFGMVAICFYHI